MINRILSQKITGRLGAGRAIVLLGARRTGKTTLLKDLAQAQTVPGDTLWLNADEADVQALFEHISNGGPPLPR